MRLVKDLTQLWEKILKQFHLQLSLLIGVVVEVVVGEVKGVPCLSFSMTVMIVCSQLGFYARTLVKLRQFVRGGRGGNSGRL